MAFGGVAVVTQISDRAVRITGVNLAPSAQGTIALSGGPAADITLPGAFRALVGSYNGAALTLRDSVGVNINPDANGLTETNLQPSVIKTGGGASVADFLITVINTNTTETTQTLEIDVTFRPSHVGSPFQVSP